MAQVVELFGAPGTGKSSLARALDGRRVSDRRLVAAGRLLRIPRSRRLGRVLRRDLTPAERRQALAERREDWAELLSIIESAPLGRDVAGDALRVLHAPGWLATTLELRALADAAPDDVIVVIDEGLVQRAPIVCGPQATDIELERFLRSLPRALLQVHLVHDPTALVRRLRGRARTIDRHVGLDDGQLEDSVRADTALLERCAEMLRSLGAPVSSPDTGSGLRAIADEIVAVLGATR